MLFLYIQIYSQVFPDQNSNKSKNYVKQSYGKVFWQIAHLHLHLYEGAKYNSETLHCIGIHLLRHT